jgi:hypothetical protein
VSEDQVILLGRLAHYQAATQQLEARWNCTLEELRTRYTAPGSEDFAADDDYLQWQWYADAIKTVNAQLAAISERPSPTWKTCCASYKAGLDEHPTASNCERFNL